MGAGENCYPRPVNGRRVTYPEQSSFPRAFGQRPTYQTGKPVTVTNYIIYTYILIEKLIDFRLLHRLRTTLTEAPGKRTEKL
jgi:hypothetical protein